MTTAEPGSGATVRRRPLAWLVAAAIGLAAIAIAANVHGLAEDRPPGADDSLYASEAARWLAGRPLTTMSGEPAAVRPPAYVVTLAASTALTRDWQTAEAVVGTASVIVTVFAAAAIAWSLAGSAAALLAIGVFIVPGASEAFARSAIDGLQAAFVLTAIAVAMAVTGPTRRWATWSAVAVGGLLGLAVLTKESALALAPWPFAWAATQPAAEIRPALRWAAVATAALVAILLPWWIWVDLAVGTLFPTRIGGLRADLGVAVLAAIGFVALAVASQPERLARLVGRIGERPRWWIAVGLSVVWAGAILVAFLASDARHAVTRLPSMAAAVEAVTRMLELLLVPVLAIIAAFAALLRAERWPRLRGFMLIALLTAGLVIIVMLKNWDPRSALVPAITIGLLLPVAAAVAAQRLSRIEPTGRRLAGFAALSAVVVGASTLNLAGLVNASGNPPFMAETQRWNGAVVRDAAAWLSERLRPGETIVSSWLFATAIDASTEARYRIVETPTLQVRIGRPREPVLVPTGTLFRENARLPREAPDDWLFIRRHPTERYLVALSGEMLGDTIVQTDARFVVLTGEHPVQSTATIAADVASWPGINEAARFARGDAEIVILEVDQAAFEVGPFATQMNIALLREWSGLVRRGRGVDAGAALCELLGDRPLHVVPDDDRSQALVAQLLPAGCPVDRPTSTAPAVAGHGGPAGP